MDDTYRERRGEAIYRFKNGERPSNFFHRNVVLSFQEDAIGIRLRDVIGHRQRDVGLILSAQRVDVSPITQDLGEDIGGDAGRRTG